MYWITDNQEHLEIGGLLFLFLATSIPFIVCLRKLNSHLPKLSDYQGSFWETLPERVPEAWRVMNYDSGKPWEYLFGSFAFFILSGLLIWISFRIARSVDFENYISITFGVTLIIFIVLDWLIGRAINNPIFQAATLIVLAAITCGVGAVLAMNNQNY